MTNQYNMGECPAVDNLLNSQKKAACHVTVIAPPKITLRFRTGQDEGKDFLDLCSDAFEREGIELREYQLFHTGFEVTLNGSRYIVSTDDAGAVGQPISHDSTLELFTGEPRYNIECADGVTYQVFGSSVEAEFSTAPASWMSPLSKLVQGTTEFATSVQPDSEPTLPGAGTYQTELEPKPESEPEPEPEPESEDDDYWALR